MPLTLCLGATNFDQLVFDALGLLQRRRPISQGALRQPVPPTIRPLRQTAVAPMPNMAGPELSIVFHFVPPREGTVAHPAAVTTGGVRRTLTFIPVRPIASPGLDDL